MSDFIFRRILPLTLLVTVTASDAAVVAQPRPLQDPPLLEIKRAIHAPPVSYTHLTLPTKA